MIKYITDIRNKVTVDNGTILAIILSISLNQISIRASLKVFSLCILCKFRNYPLNGSKFLTNRSNPIQLCRIFKAPYF